MVGAMALAALLLITPGGMMTDIDEYWVQVPPPAYDHEPTIPVIHITLPEEQIDLACTRNVGLSQIACTRVGGMIPELFSNPYLPQTERAYIEAEYAAFQNICVILIPEVSKEDNISPGYQASLIRHENAHCNGIFHDPATGLGWYTWDGTPIR